MKIVKKNNLLLEEAENEIKDPEEVLSELNVKKVDKELDLDTATDDEILADIATGAKDANVAIDVEKAEEVAETVEEVAKLIVNPYGTAQPQKLKKILQRSLVTALRKKSIGDSKNFPNILIYGLAGFGKTSIVKEFCEEHNIYLFECDAKSLDQATVGGIPYPTQDPRTGEYTQAPIASSYWDSLENNGYEYTILFLDEINRANGRIRGSLLDLINSHQLPAFFKDPKTGKTKTVKKFNKILFSVVAINPADEIFPDADLNDPAMVSRHGVVVEQEPNKKEFFNVLNNLYTKILNLDLSPEDYKVYAGQRDLMKAILNDSSFKFNDADTVKRKFSDGADQGKVYNYLNYRSFTLLLDRCDGTRDDFLDVIEYESGLGNEDINMFKSILSTYKDKVTVGNSVFGNGTPTSVNVKSAIEAQNLLDDFIDKL